MDFYEINSSTLCLMEMPNGNTYIIEEDSEFEVSANIHKIVDESCRSFGSSLEGRLLGTTKLTNNRYKAPILVSEALDIILLPTGSRRGEVCHWLCFNCIKEYDEIKDRKDIKYKSYVRFVNDRIVNLEITKNILKNQMNKCAMLKHCLELKNKG